MAEIHPFRALHYNLSDSSDLGQVVTQPYDKITPAMQARYYDLNPHNLVRIIRGRQQSDDSLSNNVYVRAARDFRDWIDQRVLISEPQPAIFPYYQEHDLPGDPGSRKKRRGFIALARLEDYAARVVHRHEETLSAPKADRLELLKATRAHFGQIFMLYSDPGAVIENLLDDHTAQSPWMQVTDEFGARHCAWRVNDPQVIECVVAAMRSKPLVIADGHHRYETALAYRKLCREQQRPDDGAEYVMMTFIRKEGDGLTVLPTHRLVHSLADFDWKNLVAVAQAFFEVEDVPVQGHAEEWGARFTARLAEAGCHGPSLGVYAHRHNPVILRVRADKAIELDHLLEGVPIGLRRLDVVILHLLLEQALRIDRQAVREEKHLRYERETQVALHEVEQGAAQACFLMNPTPIEAVWENALAGQPLPQKSTDFYPKLLSGLTIYWLDNPQGR